MSKVYVSCRFCNGPVPAARQGPCCPTCYQRLRRNGLCLRCGSPARLWPPCCPSERERWDHERPERVARARELVRELGPRRKLPEPETPKNELAAAWASNKRHACPLVYSRKRWAELLDQELQRLDGAARPAEFSSAIEWAVWCVQDRIDMWHEGDGGWGASYLGSSSLLADLGV